ncbi:MAG: choice-of-anchor Q domain-containing protein [Pseudonocardia sp.]
MAAPCQTLERAYRVASPGEVVQVAAGSYPKQFLTNDPSKTGQAWVVFRPAPGAAVNIAYFDVDGTDSVEFRDMTANGYYVRTGSDRVTFRNIRSSGNGHYVTGASNVSILGGELHSIDSVDGLQVKSREGVDTTNLLIEGLTIRNVTRNRDPQAHTECIQFTSGIRVIIRYCRFVDCSTQGVFFKEASGGSIREVLVEYSWFGTITGFNTLIFDDGVSDATARYNSFAQAPRLGHATTRNIAVYANAGVLASCVSGTTYWRNVWTDAKCASTDLRADPRFLNLNGFDLRLSQGSPAVDRGDPSAHPAGDAFGRARPQGAAPDAGSHELR